MAKTKTRAANLSVPQNRDEASVAIARIGEIGRELARREADMNDALARIKQECEKAAEPLRQEGENLTEGLKTWAEANRAMLTSGNKVKFALLGTGKILWRLRPAKVTAPKDQTVVLATLRTLGLTRFIRTKEEVNREAMLAEPAVARTVAGIRIGSEGEDFVVEPFETELQGAA